ncbi:MAG: Ldh family oxidoreductase [Proteobacteria bacterium]|nr:Ldh family oxidoreductase [Pseudomonadota bacterium]
MAAGSTHQVFTAAVLRAGCVSLFEKIGVPREDGELFTDACLDSELRGEQSHGVRLVPVHLARIKAGSIRPKPKVTVLLDRGACALFDAHLSLGQVVAARAMRLAIAKAREFGVGIVGVRNANAYASAKYYPLMAAKAGMIGINRGNTCPMMPPHGGATPIVGNNPISIAAPAGEEHPFVLDMACATAKEKIRQAAAEGRPIPPEWALGHDGTPTTDAEEALATGVLLPFGGYKAFGLAASHEVLTSVLFGGHLFCAGGGAFRPYETPYNGSQFFQAIDVEWFMPLPEFRERMDRMIRAIKAARLRPGVERVYVPGERGFLEMERRRREGIPVHSGTIADLRRWAGELGTEPIGGPASAT